MTLGNSAFKCSKLKEIALPDSIEKLGINVFEGCAFLRSCKLPRRLEYLPNSTFANCTSLEIIYFGPFIVGAKKNCYTGCTALKELHYEGKLDDFMQMNVSYAGATKIVASDGMWVNENGDQYFYYY